MLPLGARPLQGADSGHWIHGVPSSLSRGHSGEQRDKKEGRSTGESWGCRGTKAQVLQKM